MSSSFHCTFPQRHLYPVPEHETDNFSGANPLQYNASTAPSSLKNGRQSQFLSMSNFSMSSNHSELHESRAWFRRGLPRPENRNAGRRVHRWRTSVYLVLHFISLAASTAIVALIAQALISHRKVQHVRQFSGTDNAWPRNMSLTASTILLSAAVANVVKAATCSGIEAHHWARPYNDRFLGLSAIFSALMAIMWIPASVIAEINRKRDNDFATWSCARSGAAFNQVIPYRAICNEEVC